jgi:hypothetical protein
MEPRIEHAASSEAWLRHTLEEILMQVRVLLDVDGCAFQTIDWERGHIRVAAAWFETPEIRTTLRPVLDRAYDPDRGGVTETAIEQGRPLLLDDVEHWPGGAALRSRLRAQLDELGIVRVVQRMVREDGDEHGRRAGGVREAMAERDRVERSLLGIHGDDDVPGHDRQDDNAP